MSQAAVLTIWKKFRRAIRTNGLSPGVRRILIGVVGVVVVSAGLAMIILPGPAFIFIPLGFAILATEFSWARRCLRKARDGFKNIRKKLQC